MKEALIPPWQIPPILLQLGKGHLDVWRAHVPSFAPWIKRFNECLQPEERRRASRARSHCEKIARILGRAAPRILISNYTGISSSRLKFSRSTLGKPELEPSSGLSHLRFNVSYSKDWLILAVGNGLKVGVDVEYVDENFPAEEIATRFFTAKETVAIRAARDPQRYRFFFDMWVRKEAYLKAVGRGLFQELDSFEVPTGSLAVVPVSPEKSAAAIDGKESQWLFCDIPVDPHYAAAVVTSPPPLTIHLLDWNPAATKFI